MNTSRRGYLASVGAAGLTALAGCSGVFGAPASTTRNRSTDDTTGPPLADEQLPLPDDPAALRQEVVSGGVPKDGIPPVEEPSFVSAADAKLADGAPVFGVEIGGDARAYPQAILVAHEIVNDVVGGKPVSVTYCPLTGTAMGFHRGETTFGVSGRLLNNNLVMYDRATDGRWPQVLGTAIDGPHEGKSLREFRIVWTTWRRWERAHPDTRVLSRETGFARNYDTDPYGQYNPPGGYYTSSSTIFPRLHDDDRLDRKTVVIGARTPAGAMAVEKERLRQDGVVSGSLGADPAVAVHEPALDTGYVYHNAEGRRVEPTDGGVSVGGDPVSPDALPLDGVLALDAMWFAWAGFYPETTLHA